RITFGSEQARSLVVSGNYIKEKPSLLGQEYFRQTSEGHKLFSGALFSYTLIPLQFLFNFDPYQITIYFALLNVFTGLVLFYLVKKVFNYEVAVFSSIFFLFSSYMIYHSMFIWILNYYPLIGLVVLYFLYLFYKKQTIKNIFLLGLISGLATNFHYLFIPFFLLIFLYVLVKSEKKVRNLVVITFGFLLGDITMVLFDLRHDFYHLRTLLKYSQDVIQGIGGAGFIYYHFLHLWPLFALIAGFVLYIIWKKNKVIASLIILLYVFVNLTSNKVNFNEPTGMPNGLYYKDVINASRAISEDVDGSFNVASVLDFDKRGYILRYPTIFMFDKTPMGVIDYPETKVLYVISNKDYNFDKPEVWELKVVYPYKVLELISLNDDYAVYKLEK
ncbi:glycosyltransferase family 39 protein, partial [Patescibacteria group bacterium]|nr:glycosyltransferase family 39 protein [Patescibacteria group bacterium]